MDADVYVTCHLSIRALICKSTPGSTKIDLVAETAKSFDADRLNTLRVLPGSRKTKRLPILAESCHTVAALFAPQPAVNEALLAIAVFGLLPSGPPDEVKQLQSPTAGIPLA